MNQRINEQGQGIITKGWLENVVKEMSDLTNIWPYLTIKGYVQDSKHDSAATLDEVIHFMKDSDYKLIYVQPTNKDLQEIVFKKENIKKFA